ncbi:MAG TPA: adenylate/guanylate cyclase domain-containing protein [Candidatus Gastranaerophilaceae bacterium]|nr:adenylate/guanylate cyclase domain-containing protein [Candidatus Gastranaerophilaceae bacterium]
MKSVKNVKSLVITVAIIVFMLVAYFISASFFEPKAYNFMVRNFSANKVGSDEIALIIIDDKSLSQIRWPWKRNLYGKIFRYINEYTTAKVIGFDAIIATPDKENLKSDEEFYNSIKTIKNLVVGFVALNSPYENKTDGIRYDEKFKNKFYVEVNDKRKNIYPSFYRSLSKYPAQYFNTVNKSGSIVTTNDVDGYIRVVDQFIDYKGTLYPSLALRMYDYLEQGDEKFIVKDKKITLEGSKLNIPVFSNYGGIFNNIKYYKLRPNSQYSHKTFSAIDIIQSYDALKQGKTPTVSPQNFEDKIVFLGANAKAMAIGLADKKRTPMLEDYPGVDIQATNLDNIMHNEFLVQTTLFQDIITILTLLAASFLIVMNFSLFASISINALLMLAYITACVFCYRFGLVISVITPIVLQVITMTVAYSYRFVLEGQNKEKIKKAMGKYISNDVMQNVVKNIDTLSLGGKRANVTVLFADIRGFTSMSEKLSAEEVSLILNEYFTEIEPIISKYNGVINKFIGDAVMAIFGEPIQDKNHALNAVKCADEMLKKVCELQKKWLAEGKPKIEIGVGINTGEAFVGNIGSETRLEYTVIGDMVNLASRIESYNKTYKTNFLISSTTYEKVRNIVDVIKISEVTIRGKAKKMDIYEVLRLVI